MSVTLVRSNLIRLNVRRYFDHIKWTVRCARFGVAHARSWQADQQTSREQDQVHLYFDCVARLCSMRVAHNIHASHVDRPINSVNWRLLRLNECNRTRQTDHHTHTHTIAKHFPIARLPSASLMTVVSYSCDSAQCSPIATKEAWTIL